MGSQTDASDNAFSYRRACSVTIFLISSYCLMLGQELPHCYLTDAFSYGEMSYEGGQAKENVPYHGKMPTRDQFT